MDDDPGPGLGDLPEAVRTRVVDLVARVLPTLTPLPPSLRKVADFAPARRARVGERTIVAALADDELRERAATQVAALVADPAPAAAVTPESSDPVDVAAVTWLLRPEGWSERLQDAVTRVRESGREAPSADELHRLRRRAEAADQALREARTEHRSRVQELKDENTSLRRRLGEERAAARAGREEQDRTVRSAQETASAAEQRAGRADTEVRRLRAQVEQLAAELQSVRREERSGRDEATVRARLLLDTLLDAATGLRRELALPPVTGVPADSVDADLATEGVRPSSAAGALGPASPALLEHLLAMPRARLVVDGYNVSKTAWPTSSLEAQRTRLLAALGPVVARTGVETTVVFDAHGSTTRAPVQSPRGVRVAFSPHGVIADDVIRDYVAAEPAGRMVVVVTSDQALATDLRAAGARVVWSAALIGLLQG